MIAVLMGGWSQEREISLKSGEAVYNSLKAQGIESFKFDVKKNNLEELFSKKISKAFIILHGRGGEDGYIQSELEKRYIPYTGSKVFASKLAMDKLRTKAVWASNSLPIAPSIEYSEGIKFDDIKFTLPWAVKPILEGSSIGINKVEKKSQFIKAINNAKKFDSKIMIEKWIEGDEYTVSILKNQALPVIKVKVKNGFYDYEAKYKSNSTQYIIPSGLSKEKEKELQNLSLKAFDLIKAKDWGRVDIMRDNDGKPYLLELNTVPGMTSHSLVPMAANAAAISFDELVYKILN